MPMAKQSGEIHIRISANSIQEFSYYFILYPTNPVVNITAMNFTHNTGKKKNTHDIHTDKHVTQSNGFNLFPHGNFNFLLIHAGIPATFTK
jgi:hypothetical protein